MKVLDFFAGLQGWSEPWRERGHEVFTVDWDERFDVDLHADISQLTPGDLPWRPDIVLASPPCERFSVLQIGANWTGPDDHPPHAPKTRCRSCKRRFVAPERPDRCPDCTSTDLDDGARDALALADRTVELIRALEPAYFVIENPVGKLRKLEPVQDLDRTTVTYCRYGMMWRKPTDLWGGFPPSWRPRPECRSLPRRHGTKEVDGQTWTLNAAGEPCHISAERGADADVQGREMREFRLEHPSTEPPEETSSNGGPDNPRMTLHKASHRSVGRAADRYLSNHAKAIARNAGTWDKQVLAALRAIVPPELSLEVCRAAEEDLAAGRAPRKSRLF